MLLPAFDPPNRVNATEISGAMHELGELQRRTASLRQQLLSNNAELQAAGAAFAARLDEVQEVTALQQGVADARKVGAAPAALLGGWLCGGVASCRLVRSSTHLQAQPPASSAEKRLPAPCLAGRGGGAGGPAPVRPRRAAD